MGYEKRKPGTLARRALKWGLHVGSVMTSNLGELSPCLIIYIENASPFFTCAMKGLFFMHPPYDREHLTGTLSSLGPSAALRSLNPAPPEQGSAAQPMDQERREYLLGVLDHKEDA